MVMIPPPPEPPYNHEVSGDMAAPELTWRERALRDLFVQEYLVDYDQYAAALRCGYSAVYAREESVKLMNEPYVRQRIKDKEVLPDDEDNPEKMKNYVVVGLRREANYRGAGASPSARVAALAKISSIYGLDAPTKTKNEHTGADGAALMAGTIVIPGLMTMEQWAEAAAAQQAALVKDNTTANE
jgi:hypothetical protein